MPNLETGKFEPLITGDDDGALTKDEEMQFRNMVSRQPNQRPSKPIIKVYVQVHRLHKIFKYAKKQNVRVMVDAEQSYFQPAIHRLETSSCFQSDSNCLSG